MTDKETNMSSAITRLRGTRKALVGAAMTMTTAASLLVIAPAADAAGSCTLKPQGIEATDLEDNSWYWWDDTDEISVNYDSNRYLFSTVKVNQPAYPPNFTFSGSVRVELREWDEDLNGSNKYLGEINVYEADSGRGSLTQFFGRSNTNGYEYLFRYTVDCGTTGTPIGNVVPDVYGRTATEATNVLQNAGYVVYRYSRADCGPAGYVLDQDPDAGTPLARGGTVRIYVSSYYRYCFSNQ